MKEIKENNTNSTHLTPLYRHVFYGRFSSVVVLLLLSSIVLQPIDRAHASEDTVTVPTAAPIDTTAAITVNDSPPSAPADVTPTPAVTVESTDTNPIPTVGDISESTTSTPIESTTSVPVVAPAEITSGSIASDTSSSTPVDSVTPVVESSQPSSEAPHTSSSNSEFVQASSTPTVIDSSATSTSEMLATSTATTSGSTFTVTTIPTSDSDIQFNKSDCVAVADGSYYCHAKQTATSSDVKDGLYSQPDVDGDLEIYFAKNGTLEQITRNTVDDASPFYDSISNTIVWHRMINDRYQIISYDVASGAESQITTDTVNNMEPNRAGKYTVWQHWNKDNWDIMLYDGSSIKLLTDTPQHDIAPVIRGNLVMWNRLTNDKKQTIELYDLTSGEYTTINDSEGGALSNPRMVLVYDAQFENGDVVTKGYDVATGKITPLSSVPASLPDKIPPPDKTGETRALIQSKSSGREDTEPIATPKPTIDPPFPGTGSTTASTTEPGTINMQTNVATSSAIIVATSTALTLDLRATTSLQITQSDVVVPTFTVASTTE